MESAFPVFTTILTAALLAGLRWAWVTFRKVLNEGKTDLAEKVERDKKEIVGFLERIESLAHVTNGRVTTLEAEIIGLRERQSNLEGQAYVLLREKGLAP